MRPPKYPSAPSRGGGGKAVIKHRLREFGWGVTRLSVVQICWPSDKPLNVFWHSHKLTRPNVRSMPSGVCPPPPSCPWERDDET